ncbi:hypothetical protein BWI17_18400 [Betaproteobacteria bacterium GR16-43]|nr:hypothetical protein BWI17_18400 [Betaproteobacteria bacterium GR16-43]
MNRNLLAVLFLLTSTAASAVTVAVTPASPSPSDTLVLEISGVSPCTMLTGEPPTMSDGRVIRVSYNGGGVEFQCIDPPPLPIRVPLGRLPVGTYRVELVPYFSATGVPAATGTPDAAVTVTVSGFTNDTPYDDYSGHYGTNIDYEGVTVWQQGRRALISYLYQGSDGKPEWVVIPEATWGLLPGGGVGFTGEVLYVGALEAGGVSVIGTSGTGYFQPSSHYGTAVFVVSTPRAGPLERLLTRLRF